VNRGHEFVFDILLSVLWIKEQGLLPYVATWMNFEDVILNEISELQKDTYCMIKFI
jgi:hypothetical protein